MRLCCEGRIIYLQDVLREHHFERNKGDKLPVLFGLKKTWAHKYKFNKHKGCVQGEVKVLLQEERLKYLDEAFLTRPIRMLGNLICSDLEGIKYHKGCGQSIINFQLNTRMCRAGAGGSGIHDADVSLSTLGVQHPTEIPEWVGLERNSWPISFLLWVGISSAGPGFSKPCPA